MADRPQVHVHPQQHYDAGMKGIVPRPSTGPSTSQIIAVVTLLPIGATLLGLAGITLVATLLALAIATPLFLLCSPILVPAAIVVAGAVAGFLTSGAFGLTGLSSLSWVFNSLMQATGQEPLEYAKRRMQEATIQVGEKTKQVGEMMGDKTKQAGEAIKSGGGGGGATTTRT